jgi:hypothetical protein
LEDGKQEAAAHAAGPTVAHIHEQLASAETVGWLSAVTGIGDLRPDPSRLGGGIHQHGPGGRLALHTDFDTLRGSDPPLVRAVNVIVFISAPRQGGWLLLHNPQTEEWAGINPTPGRLVAFEASARSWHGHPIPLYDNSEPRRSIPAYYYRPGRGENRSTRFLEQT